MYQTCNEHLTRHSSQEDEDEDDQALNFVLKEFIVAYVFTQHYVNTIDKKTYSLFLKFKDFMSVIVNIFWQK